MHFDCSVLEAVSYMPLGLRRSFSKPALAAGFIPNVSGVFWFMRQLLVCATLLAIPFGARAQKIRLSDTNSSVGRGYAPPEHVPPALLAAKTIFLSNLGADSGLFPQPFSGDPNRGYYGLYAALNNSGQHKLVDDPASADLVLELRLVAPNGPSSGNKQNGASDPLPMFQLVIYDEKAHYALWALTESIDVAVLQKTHDKNFDQALLDLAYDFDQVTGKLPPAKP